jgi:hypothetical protein
MSCSTRLYSTHSRTYALSLSTGGTAGSDAGRGVSGMRRQRIAGSRTAVWRFFSAPQDHLKKACARRSRNTWHGCDAREPVGQGPLEPFRMWRTLWRTRPSLYVIRAPGDLEAQIEAFVAEYNHRRCLESINNLILADVYFGRGKIILLHREGIKRHTNAACSINGKRHNVISQMSQSHP